MARSTTWSWAVIVTVAVATLVGAVRLERRPRPPIAADEQVLVARVLDGDTVVVQRVDGTTLTVRMLGVDTPETHHPSKPVGCFGPEAAAHTAQRLGGRVVRLELDREWFDRYGRLLATVIVDGASYSAELVEQGYARVLAIAPNDAHARSLLLAESQARRNGVGLWGAC